jgi:hypothetical protein
VLRHFAASFAVIAAACLLWTLAYAGLLGWAILSGGGLGGPLAYPGGLIVVGVAAAITSATLLFPATVAAELLTRRFPLRFLAQVAVAVAVLAALSIAFSPLLVAWRGLASARVFTVAAWIFGLSLVPLGIYWWALLGSKCATISRRGRSR